MTAGAVGVGRGGRDGEDKQAEDPDADHDVRAHIGVLTPALR